MKTSSSPTHHRLLLISAASLLWIPLFVACSGGESEKGAGQELSADGSASARVDAWIAADNYQEALDFLATQDASSPEIRLLLEKTHLNLAFYSMSTFDPGQMRTRMNDALRNFAAVLRINPANETAREQINQILGVYRTMPGRGPEEDVTTELRSLGFNL